MPSRRAAAPLVAVLAAVTWPLLFSSGSALVEDATLALAYAVMAVGLNVVVGLAGLLDLGYVVFFALGAYTTGWLASGFVAAVNDGNGVHVGVSGIVTELPGIHVNLLLVLIAAALVAAAAGVLIGIPTLRLRADYIAIVTLAFGEIISRVAINGGGLRPADVPLVGPLIADAVGTEQPLTAGRMGITPVDKIALPGLEPFTTLNLRPWYWTALGLLAVTTFVCVRLRDSRVGRAWAALRDDEAAAVAMGVPSVRTKLLAYGIGAAFGGAAGAFIASFENTVNADSFEIWFSILILGMVVLGGMGSVWGAIAGAVTLTFINYWLIPDVVNGLPRSFGFDFDMTDLTFAFYGLLLVLMMVLRPDGLLPQRAAPAGARPTPSRPRDSSPRSDRRTATAASG